MKKVLIFVVIIAIIAGLHWWLKQNKPALPADGDGPMICTQDAMQCPDGSYVGRVGPACEFAPCPGAAN